MAASRGAPLRPLASCQASQAESGRCRDPLERVDLRELARRCCEHLRAEAWLLDARDLMRATLAVLTYRLAGVSEEERGTPNLAAACMADSIAEATEQVRAEDRRKLEAGFPGLHAGGDRARHLSLNLGVHPDRARRACVLFNGLPREARRVFFALLIERLEFVECLEQGLASSVEGLKSLLSLAMESLHGERALGRGASPRTDLERSLHRRSGSESCACDPSRRGPRRP